MTLRIFTSQWSAVLSPASSTQSLQPRSCDNVAHPSCWPQRRTPSFRASGQPAAAKGDTPSPDGPRSGCAWVAVHRSQECAVPRFGPPTRAELRLLAAQFGDRQACLVCCLSHPPRSGLLCGWHAHPRRTSPYGSIRDSPAVAVAAGAVCADVRRWSPRRAVPGRRCAAAGRRAFLPGILSATAAAVWLPLGD